MADPGKFTKTASQIMDEPGALAGGKRLFGQLMGGEGAAAGGSMSPQMRRAIVSGSDDVAAVLANPSLSPIAPATFNPALIDGNDIDNARDAGKAASQRLKNGRAQRERDALKNGAGPEDLGQPVQPVNRVKEHFQGRQVGEEAAAFKLADPVMRVTETVASVAGGVTAVAELGLPLLGAGVGLVGAKSAQTFLNKPNEYLNPKDMADKKGHVSKGTHINNAMMAGFSAVAVYGVAKSASQGLSALDAMNEAMTGKKLSTMALLTSSNVPDVVKQARSHFLKEHISRGAVNLLSLGLIGRSVIKKKAPSPPEFLIPMGIGMGIDILMGESALPFFAGVQNAHKAGQELPPQAYGEFLLAASQDLKRRGPIGKRVAMALGDEFAAEKASPAAIMVLIEESIQAHKQGKKGKLDERIDNVIAKAEMEKAAHHQAPQAALAAPQAAVQHPQASMVDKIGAAGKSRDINVKGKFTEKLKQEMAAPSLGVGNVTVA